MKHLAKNVLDRRTHLAQSSNQASDLRAWFLLQVFSCPRRGSADLFLFVIGGDQPYVFLLQGSIQPELRDIRKVLDADFRSPQRLKEFVLLRRELVKAITDDSR